MNFNGLCRWCHDFIRIVCSGGDLIFVENLPIDTGGYRIRGVMVEDDDLVVQCQFMHRNMVVL